MSSNPVEAISFVEHLYRFDYEKFSVDNDLNWNLRVTDTRSRLSIWISESQSTSFGGLGLVTETMVDSSSPESHTDEKIKLYHISC